MLSDLHELEVATVHQGSTTAQLIGLGLLLHELVYLSSKGWSHLVETTAPVLGVRVPAPACIVLHIGLVASSMSLVLAPTAAGVMASLALLLLRIACFPVRLPNHLIVAWFFLLALSLDGLRTPDCHGTVGEFGLGAIQIITALTYGIAGLHKLNHDYLHPRTSCGAGLLVHYLLQKGIPLRTWPRMVEPIGIHAVLLAELLLPAMLFVDQTRAFAITVAFFMHIAFGFLAHVHFAIVMLAGLAAFCPDAAPLFDLPLRALAPMMLVAITAGHLLGNHRPYRWPFMARLNHIVFALIALLTARVLVESSAQGLACHAALAAPIGCAAVVVLFLVNGFAPYLGLKFDFSLAMFSNLRPDTWRHLLMPQPRYPLAPRYARIDGLVGMPGETRVARSIEAYAASRFPHAESWVFSIGYVRDAVREIVHHLPAGHSFGIAVTMIPRNEKRVVDAAFDLRVSERLSIFPYSLPSGNEPLCH